MPTLVGDRYRLIQQLGQGGMGRIWRGYDEVLGREVAVKELVVPAGVPADERKRLRERSMREARAIARLNHPNVIRVFDVVKTEGGDPWIVMEYVRGRSLQDVLPVPPQWAASIGLGVLGALGAAHQAGVVHRDVKPSNVLLADDGRVLLTDWGIAVVPGDPNITQTGVMFGSPAYMAPERVTDTKAAPVSDLWSLGATLYAAVEGKSPFARATSMASLAALTTDPVPSAPHAGALAPVLNGLLRKDPALRMGAKEAERLLKAAKAAPIKPTAVVPAPGFPPTKPQPVPGPMRPPPARPAVRPASGRLPARRSGPSPLVVCLILLALVALLLLIFRPWESSHRGGPNTATSPPASTSPTAAVESASPPAAPPSPQPAATGFQLPSGWRMVKDPSGFALPIPNGWRSGHDDDGRPYWRDPNNGTFVLIDQRRDPQPDPVQDWKNNEAARRDSYDDYQRIRIEAVDYWDKAADWEFTYTSRSGTPLHVNNRGFITAPDQAYSIYWSTRADQWNAEYQRLQVIFAGFDPARS